MKTPKTGTDKDMKAISDIITKNPYGLDVEIIWSAMNFLRQHPSYSIESAIEFGVDEWIK